ncbi:hypothetical protein P7K49_002232 [Saguinus oedipus]|uniref:Uncharacterized protein n=1 Tax=Saguinus oedipus TaxID=9490 RepID=A0ABQ9WHS6_SAGOE|nr:hypothetical protein P7K49_002232 [Saguinus oedipus]
MGAAASRRRALRSEAMSSCGECGGAACPGPRPEPPTPPESAPAPRRFPGSRAPASHTAEPSQCFASRAPSWGFSPRLPPPGPLPCPTLASGSGTASVPQGTAAAGPRDPSPRADGQAPGLQACPGRTRTKGAWAHDAEGLAGDGNPGSCCSPAFGRVVPWPLTVPSLSTLRAARAFGEYLSQSHPESRNGAGALPGWLPHIPCPPCPSPRSSSQRSSPWHPPRLGRWHGNRPPGSPRAGTTASGGQLVGGGGKLAPDKRCDHRLGGGLPVPTRQDRTQVAWSHPAPTHMQRLQGQIGRLGFGQRQPLAEARCPLGVSCLRPAMKPAGGSQELQAHLLSLPDHLLADAYSGHDGSPEMQPAPQNKRRLSLVSNGCYEGSLSEEPGIRKPAGEGPQPRVYTISGEPALLPSPEAEAIELAVVKGRRQRHPHHHSQPLRASPGGSREDVSRPCQSWAGSRQGSKECPGCAPLAPGPTPRAFGLDPPPLPEASGRRKKLERMHSVDRVSACQRTQDSGLNPPAPAAAPTLHELWAPSPQQNPPGLMVHFGPARTRSIKKCFPEEGAWEDLKGYVGRKHSLIGRLCCPLRVLESCWGPARQWAPFSSIVELCLTESHSFLAPGKGCGGPGMGTVLSKVVSSLSEGLQLEHGGCRGNRHMFSPGLLGTDHHFKGMFLKLRVAKGKIKPKKSKCQVTKNVVLVSEQQALEHCPLALCRDATLRQPPPTRPGCRLLLTPDSEVGERLLKPLLHPSHHSFLSLSDDTPIRTWFPKENGKHNYASVSFVPTTRGQAGWPFSADQEAPLFPSLWAYQGRLLLNSLKYLCSARPARASWLDALSPPMAGAQPAPVLWSADLAQGCS